MAKYWTEKICDALDRIDDPEVLWRDEAIERFNREFRESELSKHISEVAERNTASRKYLFVELNTRERMMENWELLRKMIMGE